jgi:hypothetical protein
VGVVVDIAVLLPEARNHIRHPSLTRNSLVGSAWGAVPGLLPVRFPRPPAEPDVRLSPHPALRVLVPMVGSQAAVLGVHGVGMPAPR